MNKYTKMEASLLVSVMALSLGGAALAQEAAVFTGDVSADPDSVMIGAKEYSPYLHRSFPTRVLFGDTHVHTSYSTDAGMIGNILGPEAAFQFARGEVVRGSMGVRTRLIHPLDFIVVSDHAENLGLAPLIARSDPELLRSAWGKKVHDLVKAGNAFEAYGVWGLEMSSGNDPLKNDELTVSMWNSLVDIAEEYNEPGIFTALHGFEWTSSPGSNNLHRNVIFRGDKSDVEDMVPFSNYDSTDPEDLWAWMEAFENRTGAKALAIAHGGNLSNGLMFDDKTLGGDPLTLEYAKKRIKYEPLYEVTQIKGDSEAHPSLSPNDEFADYYSWDKGNFGLQGKTPDMLPKEYVRQALIKGLEHEEILGANPFKFGLIGSTDTHTSLATTREDNYFGKVSAVEPGTGEERYMEQITGVVPSLDGSDVNIYNYQSLASGLAAVWSRENTRESIWDAMARKEVYATTGTRMTVRLFAGWDFEASEVVRPDFAEQGYARGVPMGGDLTSAPEGNAPKFMVRALRDPNGANLDRIQIVKGWVGEGGTLEETVYDVAWAGDRTPDENGKLPPVGNTVQGAEFTNDIGRAVLAAHWEDPDFDPNERAVYYVRVLEIPTPTWLAYDKAYYGDAMIVPEDALWVHQERAYTSPVWYTPG